MIGMSIIICCYNSAKRIIRTLEHIVDQKVKSEILWEVILVDNASSDNTKATVEQFWKNNNVAPLSIIDQNIPGLSFAREKGMKQAKYEYLLFCDDDNWLYPNYVQTAFYIMEDNEKIGALGGLGIPKFEIKPDKWIQKYSSVYATGGQADVAGETSSSVVYGAGCVNRKSAIEALFSNDFKYYLTGRQGEKLTAGEDHELCYALFLSGYKIWFDERLKFSHYIPKERINYCYITKSMKEFSKSAFYLNIYKILIKKGLKHSCKKSWTWIMLNKFRFLIISFIVYVKNKNKFQDPFATPILKIEIKGLFYFLLHRRKFLQIIKELESSSWLYSKNN